MTREAQVSEAIQAETSRFIARGAQYAAALGVIASVVLIILRITTGDTLFELPAAFSMVGAAWTTILSITAQRSALVGWKRDLVMLGLVSLPTGLFLATHLLKPAGAATFITGPFINLYGFLLVITGFLLSFRLSVIAGLVVSAEYLFVFSLARPFLSKVQSGDATFLEDLSGWPIAFNRALMFIATGLAVGGFALLVRRLVVR
ncbi:MAG TPA: hypothetical protein VGD87_05340, partial [Archangium sp.]